MARLRTLDDLEVAGRTVLVRLDLNVPISDGVVGDEAEERLGHRDAKRLGMPAG